MCSSCRKRREGEDVKLAPVQFSFFLSPRSVSVGPRINEIHTAGFLGYGEHLDDAYVNK